MPGATVRAIVTNTSGGSATADLFLDFGGKSHPSAPLVFMPHEMKALSVVELLGVLGLSAAHLPAGGITVIPRGPNPTLIAQGRITDPATGFSTTLNFPDPAWQLASALDASRVHHYLPKLQLQPHVPPAIDLGKLHEAQKPDSK